MKKNKLITYLLTFLLLFTLVGCNIDESDTENNTEDKNRSFLSNEANKPYRENPITTDDIEQNIDNTQTELPPQDTSKLSFTLKAGEAGEYGKLITYNKNTEFEETFYGYYVPEGTYTVTNKGNYMDQINVYSDETKITEEGWEEPKSCDTAKLLDVGQSDTIIIEKGQHIVIVEPALFEFEKQ